MTMNPIASGLTSLCLMLLAGCNSAPLSPERPLTISGCPAVTPCSLESAAPKDNGGLQTEVERIGLAWAECAAKVDMIIRTQGAPHEQAR
ncbi:TPA: Rz1-like lysis system protein LysC [Pseudomonas aeruginosa]|uniref:Rz1-like lysis system protein LysC n=1 Tax=Pseudomonas aeruginosa TaxID=287 RepID=UPI001CC1DE03|nr:Rz1-like lysis system protein LysC [Pseudomonas aeruginosa]MCH1382552.1 Rz1-like lysis system protein LysC [Pseudomonas aeruginosa E2]MCC0113419.1 Rz1-like lysis system protein LysC [Pseudomonas aeruginosa]MCH0825922.1 Rz1-like lysis system protein LysC [Pseudomonas aeruginosa]MCH0832281.1 Rz1-like lysis system protein LysC [Pseudomonas aeruginosa]MCH0838209.1 Rz1-like lysis system protein LysC [Pseudomonas aeruginosa]